MVAKIHELEEAVRRLSPQERAIFRAWFIRFDAEQWDRQIEADSNSGKLDWLIDEARRERSAGRTTDL